MPIVGNFLKGLSVAVPLHLATLQARRDGRAAARGARERYAGERFVRVMPLRDAAALDRRLLRRAGVQRHQPGRPVRVRAATTQVLLMCRLDNLGKGASGAAVQSMNVHLGLDEATGLV